MPGTGTKPGITTNKPPPARLLDLTRLTRRAGRRMTGIDRVEYAYARALSQRSEPCFGLVRSRFGYLLIDPDRLWQAVCDVCGGQSARVDTLSRIALRLDAQQKAAETTMRRAARARSLRAGVRGLLARNIPPGFAYINVGHSNLTMSMLDAVRASGGRSAVMIHDVIPLEFPQYQGAGGSARFSKLIAAAQAGAQILIYNSEDTKRRAADHLAQLGPVPSGVVAPLGTDLVNESPKPTVPSDPYFLCVGTIEPRKNIGFLLDIWDRLGPDAPMLVLCGARGWNNEDVFARLDKLSKNGRILELPHCEDEEMFGLMRGARALLMPSLAEGFGLPAVEAAKLGVPVMCHPLPVFHELLGDYPLYADVDKPGDWIHHVTRLAAGDIAVRDPQHLPALSWDAHFKTVLSMT